MAKKELSVVARIGDGSGRYLFIDHVKKNGWSFPGGKINDGESPLEAMQRELKEELDIEITDDRLQLLVWIDQEDLEYPVGSGNLISFRQLVYDITVTDSEKSKIRNVEPDKARDIKWFTMDEVLEMNAVVSLRDAIAAINDRVE